MGDFFNKLKSEMNESWGGLDKGQKTKIIIISALFITVLVGFILYAGAPRWEPLYYSTDPVTAGKIHQQIREKGHNIRVEGNTLFVPKGRAADLQMELYAEGVLTSEGSLPQANTGNNFLMTADDKRQMYLQQKQNEIRHGLLTLDGVSDATVILQLPNTDSFVLSNSEKRGSASLIVKMKSGAQALSRSKVNGIISFVSKSVGIKEEDVEVLDEAGNPLTQSQQEITDNVGSAYELQQKYSQDIEQKISKLLSRMFGKGSIEVIASVNINTSSKIINSTEFLPVDEENVKGIVSSMQEIRKNWVDAAGSGVPGTDSNTDINQYVETETGKAEYSEVNQTVNYEFNEIKKQIVEEVGNIEDLSLAITVDSSALKEDVDIESLKQELNNLVVNATKAFVPQKTSQEHLGNITIAVSEFNNSVDVAFNNQLEREAAQQRMDNMIKIGSVAAALLVLGLSMFLFIRRRSGVARDEEFELQQAVAAASAAPAIPIEEIDIEDKNELKKKIEKFVGQKPDQVATLLKSWLNEE